MKQAVSKTKSSSTVAVSIVRAVQQAAEQFGLNSATLFKMAGLDDREVREGRVSGKQFIAILDAAVHLSNDAYCGLHMGATTKPAAAHLVGHLLMNCTTLGEAINEYSRYQRIVNDLVEVRVDRRNEQFYLVLNVLDSTVSYNRQLVEWIIAGEAALLRDLGSQPIKPIRVLFAHPPPVDKSEYLRVFNAPVLFRRSINALVFSAKDLNVRIAQADAELFSLFERQAGQYLRALDQSIGYSGRVRRLLRLMMKQGNAKISPVSAELKMSPRVLQIKLRQEGTSFRQLVRDIRQELAIMYLNDETLTISEISHLLGFSEPSAFNRAFRRWTGKTPGSFARLKQREKPPVIR